MQNSQSTMTWGALQGRIELPEAVRNSAAELAVSHYRHAEAQEFCGDPVEDYLLPEWMAERASWLPQQALSALGFLPRQDTPDQLLATVGVDSHVDDIHGPVLIVVLHNDGLTFKQGRQSHKAGVGDWFVFDDARPHQVRESAKSTTYLCWAVPLQSLVS